MQWITLWPSTKLTLQQKSDGVKHISKASNNVSHEN